MKRKRFRNGGLRLCFSLVFCAGCTASFLLAVNGCCGIRPPAGATTVVRTLETTGYCDCGACCDWHRDWLFRPVYSSGPMKGKRKRVGVTASGTQARKGTIAADTRLYPFGTVMYIDGYGYGRGEDRGDAIRGNHIDLFFSTHDRALAWGRQAKRVLIWFETRVGP